LQNQIELLQEDTDEEVVTEVIEEEGIVGIKIGGQILQIR
jgi:hypothetical protein